MTEVGEEEIIRIRDAYEAFNRGDFDAAAELIHPNIVWNRVAEVEGPFRGKGAARAHMEPEIFSAQRNELHSIEAVGDWALVDCTFHGEGASSGIKLGQRGFHLWRIEDRKAIEFRYFLDRDEALAAARA